MEQLIDVPAGLHNVAVTDTVIGDVRGDEGFYHYRQYDATDLARTATFEDVWHLFETGRLPTDNERERFRADVATLRTVPPELHDLVDVVARIEDSPLSKLRTVLSASAGPTGARPMLDVEPGQRVLDARRLAAMVPAVLARLYRSAAGEPIVEPDRSNGHAAAYLHQVTGVVPRTEHARALEQYLILTVDHGFNASTFTGRVVASTGASVV